MSDSDSYFVSVHHRLEDGIGGEGLLLNLVVSDRSVHTALAQERLEEALELIPYRLVGGRPSPLLPEGYLGGGQRGVVGLRSVGVIGVYSRERRGGRGKEWSRVKRGG